MLQVKTGSGAGLKLTLLYASGTKVQLKNSKFLNVILRMPSGTTQACSNVTFDEITNDIYVKLLPAELSVVGAYAIVANVQTTDNMLVVTPMIYVVEVSNTAEDGFKEAVLSIAANVLQTPTGVSETGASPQIDPSTSCWLVYDDTLNAYVNSGVLASGYATDGMVQIARDEAAAAAAKANEAIALHNNVFEEGIVSGTTRFTAVECTDDGDSAGSIGITSQGVPFYTKGYVGEGAEKIELASKKDVITLGEEADAKSEELQTSIREAKTSAEEVNVQVDALKDGSTKTIQQISDVADAANSKSSEAIIAANQAKSDVSNIIGGSNLTLPTIEEGFNSLAETFSGIQNTIGQNETGNNNAHTQLNGRIAAEESRAKGKEQDLQENIDTEKTRAQNVETGLGLGIESVRALHNNVFEEGIVSGTTRFTAVECTDDGDSAGSIGITSQGVPFYTKGYVGEGAEKIELASKKDVKVVDDKILTNNPTQYDALLYDESISKYRNINISDLISSDQKVVRRYRLMDISGVVDQSSDVKLVNGSIYLASLPALYGLGLYLVKDDLTRKKLDPSNSNFYADGSPAKLDGTQGMIQWCCNVDMYFKQYIVQVSGKTEISENGTWLYMELSHLPILGKSALKIPSFGLFPGVWSKADSRLDAVYNTTDNYRGGNDNAALDYDLVDSGTLDGNGNPIFNQVTGHATLKGKASTNKSIGTFATGAQKHGALWNASWYVAHSAVDILMMFIMGTRNLQKTITGGTVISDTNFVKRSIPGIDGIYTGGLEGGNNNSTDWAAHNGNNPVWDLSTGFQYGDVIGCVAEDVQNWNNTGVKRRVYKSYFFGLPTNWDELWDLRNGMVCYHENVTTEGGRSKIYVAKQMSMGLTLPNADPSTLTTWKYAHDTVRTDGWIIRVAYTGLSMIPTKNGGVGSSSVCESDCCYSNGASSFGARVVLAGGSFGNGACAGPFYAYLINGVTSASAYYGAFLCHFKEEPQQYIVAWMDK